MDSAPLLSHDGFSPASPSNSMFSPFGSGSPQAWSDSRFASPKSSDRVRDLRRSLSISMSLQVRCKSEANLADLAAIDCRSCELLGDDYDYTQLADPYHSVDVGEVAMLAGQMGPLAEIAHIVDINNRWFSVLRAGHQFQRYLAVVAHLKTKQAADCEDLAEAELLERTLVEGLSTTQIGFSVSNLLIGVGILTVPYGFVYTGWMSVFVVPIVAAVFLYTGHLLGDVIDAVRSPAVPYPNYGDIGAQAFGEAWRPVFVGFCIAELFGVVVFYLVLAGKTLTVITGFSGDVCIWVSALAALLIAVLPSHYFVALTVLGVFLTAGAMGTVSVGGLALLPNQINTSQSVLGISSVSGLCFTVASVGMCVGSHACFPAIHSAAPDTKCYQSGLTLAFAFFVVVTLIFCICTYATYGMAIQPWALDNLGKDVFGQPLNWVPRWVVQACNFGLSVKILVVLPQIMIPVLKLLQDGIVRFTGVDLSCPLNTASELSLVRSDPRKFLLRMALLASCFAAGAACAQFLADSVAEFETLMSAFFKSVNVFILPCWSYYTLCGEKLQGKPHKTVFLLVVLSAGVLWGVVGTLTSIRSILVR